MPRNQRAALLGLAIAVLVVGFLVLRGGGTKTDTASGTTTIVVAGGKPSGGVQKLTFPKGGTVDFRVRSDSSGEIHVHGYDVKRSVPAGGTVTFRFPAKVDGRFVVEMESSGVQIAQLTVTP
jgi:hypothetical protein